MRAPTEELVSMWRQAIPLAAAMELDVARFDGDELTVRAPLGPNVNLHGTAFAGSLYSICALTGWGMLWLGLRARGLAPQIVLAKAGIGYRRAVTGDILCTCAFDGAAQAPRIARLADTGQASFELICTISVDGRRAVRFEGDYAVKLASEDAARTAANAPPDA